MNAILTVEEIEVRLADLRQQHADLTAGIAADDAEIAKAEALRDEAQEVFGEAVRMMAAPKAPAPEEEWSAPRPGEEERTRERIRAGGHAFEEADRLLASSLAEVTKIRQRRGHRLAALHRIDDETERVERELTLARQAPPETRSTLTSIRARLFAGRPQPAA